MYHEAGRGPIKNMDSGTLQFQLESGCCLLLAVRPWADCPSALILITGATSGSPRKFMGTQRPGQRPVVPSAQQTLAVITVFRLSV